MTETDQRAPVTFWLLFSVSICVFGNSFLYGYNIGVVNTPASLIKTFYMQTYMTRNGVDTIFKMNNLNKPELWFKNSGDADNVTTTALAPTTLALVVVPGKGTTLSPPGASTAVTYDTNTNPTNETKRDRMIARNNDDIQQDNFIDFMWSLTVAIFVLFGMIGAFASGNIADRFGRKKGMIIITVIMFLAALCGGIPIAAKSPECLIISRALVGLHCGINISLASLYLAEISPKKIRGAIGTCHQLFITIGILFSMVLGLPDLSGTWKWWPVLFAFNAVPSLVCLVAMPFCPESPRYLLIKRNDEDGAKKALVKLRGYDDVEEEMEEMRFEARKASSVQQYSMKQLLTAVDLRLPIIIAVVMQVAQQWSGINAVMSFSSFIFEQANVPSDSIPYVVVGQGAINVIATLVALPLMEKLGRRPLLIWPMCGMVVSFLVLTICLNLLQSESDPAKIKTLAIICIVVMLTYVIGFALGLGPIPFICVGEIFRQEPRAAAMSFSLAFNWITNFILMLAFRFIQKGIGAYTYIIFMVILVASILFIFFFVPETKNKTFDEIAQSISFGRGGNRRGEQDAEELQPMGGQKV